MAEQKKKRLTIREQLKEIKDMQEASRRRQKGEKITSDEVTSTRRRAEAEAKLKKGDLWRVLRLFR